MKDLAMLRITLAVATFVIGMTASAQLHLIRPNGGEIFYTNRDTTIQIAWEGIDDTLAVEISVSDNNGVSWNVIRDSAKGGAYEWRVVGARLSSGYLVRVQQVRPPAPADNVTYTRHFASVLDGAWAPSGNRVVTVGADPHVWDPDSATTIAVLSGHLAGCNTVDWSTDSLSIVSASDDNTARLWDASTYQSVRSYNHSGSVTKARFDVSGQFVATASRDDRARVFAIASGVAMLTFSHPSTLNDVEWSRQGNRIVTSSDDNLARVYNRAVGLPLVLNGHKQAGVLKSVFSPDGALVATVGGDASVRIWDAITGRQVDSVIDPRQGVRCAAFSPDATMLAIGLSDSTVVVWNISTKSRAFTFSGHLSSINDVAWNSTGSMLASASNDASVQVFDMIAGRQIRRLAHPSPVFVVRWSPDDTRVLTTAVDAARIWRIKNVVLQSDTSDRTFSISLPPPAVARLRTTGDTVNIGDRFPIELRLEGTSFIDLADIDSIAVTITYNRTMIDLESRDLVAFERDSASTRLVVLKPVALPLTNAILAVFNYRATLGTDTVTRVRVASVRQIGRGAGVAFDTVTAPILVQGICREGTAPRLFNPDGRALSIAALFKGAELDISCALSETAPMSVTVVNVLGQVVFRDVATDAEQRNRLVHRSIDASGMSAGTYIVMVITPTEQQTILVGKQ